MRDSPYTNWSYEQLPARAKGRVQRTVIAVLRTLERHVIEDMDGDLIHAFDLDEWAGVVERGEDA